MARSPLISEFLDAGNDLPNISLTTSDGVIAMNTVSTTLVNDLETLTLSDGAATVRTTGGTLLPLANGVGAEHGKAVHYGLRPEDLKLASDGAEGAIQANVAVVEPTGAEILVICRIEGQELQVVLRERAEFRSGQTISLMPNRENALLFRGEDGARIR